MSDFTNGQPFQVTDAHLKLKWGTKGGKLRCALCGHFFAEHDTCRWVFANGANSPAKWDNFFVCAGCDGADVLQRAAAHYTEFLKLREKFWRFF